MEPALTSMLKQIIYDYTLFKVKATHGSVREFRVWTVDRTKLAMHVTLCMPKEAQTHTSEI